MTTRRHKPNPANKAHNVMTAASPASTVTQKQAITLAGMSGVGKTTLALKMEAWGWVHYSCDHEIGTNILGADIAQALGTQNKKVTPGDISLLSDYIGQLGRGALDHDEFMHRQHQYIEAEKNALALACQKMDEHNGPFINDTSGSLCEINDPALLKQIADRSLLIYIKASLEDQEIIFQRAQDYPKPLYFPPDLLPGWIDNYLETHGLERAEEMEPNDFSRWVFPKLYESRMPKYDQIAQDYGITIMAQDLNDIQTQDDFMEIIRDYQPGNQAAAHL